LGLKNSILRQFHLLSFIVLVGRALVRVSSLIAAVVTNHVAQVSDIG